MTVTLSRATAEDLPAMVLADGRAFGVHHEEQDIEDLRLVLDPDRFTASEGGIYGRFGYGIASTDRRVEIDRRRAVLRAGTPDPGGVRYAGTDEVAERAPGIHRRWAAQQPGGGLAQRRVVAVHPARPAPPAPRRHGAVPPAAPRRLRGAFGGTRAHTLARAGRIAAADPAMLGRFDAACLADRDPYTGTGF